MSEETEKMILEALIRALERDGYHAELVPAGEESA